MPSPTLPHKHDIGGIAVGMAGMNISGPHPDADMGPHVMHVQMPPGQHIAHPMAPMQGSPISPQTMHAPYASIMVPAHGQVPHQMMLIPPGHQPQFIHYPVYGGENAYAQQQRFVQFPPQQRPMQNVRGPRNVSLCMRI
jgi:hypothetical protein